MQIPVVDNASLDRDTLIRGHMDMARRLARKIARRVPRHLSRDDLESAALLGLTEAASRFDPRRGEPFVAYAAKRVRGAVLDELRRGDVLTRRGRERARRLAEASRTVEAQTGAPATTAAIAEELGITVEEVSQDRARVEMPAVVPLDESRDADGGVTSPTPGELIDGAREKARLVEALAKLPERDLRILNMSFEDALTLKEIGDILGVTESRVCQLRTRALARLREFMTAA